MNQIRVFTDSRHIAKQPAGWLQATLKKLGVKRTMVMPDLQGVWSVGQHTSLTGDYRLVPDGEEWVLKRM